MRHIYAHFAKLIQLNLALLAMFFSCPSISENDVHRDPSFGNSGAVKIAIGSRDSWATAGLTQTDGKIIIAGSIYYENEGYANAIALTRILPDGVLDSEFGNKGIVITKIGGNSRATAIGMMPDGRIIVAGWAFVETGKLGITLVMYNIDGTLDTRFGDGGQLIFPMAYANGYVHSLVVQSDGNILVGGRLTVQENKRNPLLPQLLPGKYILLARLNSNGTFDSTFGMKGVVLTNVGDETGDLEITSLTLQRNEKLMVLGRRQKSSSSTLILARYNLNGTLDKSFGVDGFSNRTIETGRYSQPSVTIASDGRIYLIGGYQLKDDNFLVLSKFDVNGSPDLNFGEAGTVTTKTAFWRYSNFVPTLLPDGKILISGTSVRPPKPGQPQPPFYYSTGIARFLPNGTTDNSFGINGMHVVSIGGVTDSPVFMTVQDSGRIVIGGYSTNQQVQEVVFIGLIP